VGHCAHIAERWRRRRATGRGTCKVAIARNTKEEIAESRLTAENDPPLLRARAEN
jgi:hypothetical protein